MIEGKSHFTQHYSNQPLLMRDHCNSSRAGNANDLPAISSHPDFSEPVTKCRNNCIKIGGQERSKFRIWTFTNIEIMYSIAFACVFSCSHVPTQLRLDFGTVAA